MYSTLQDGHVSRDTRATVWAGALLLFVAGDVLTTTVGLVYLGAVEAHPGSAWALEQYGLGAMLLSKAVMVLVAVGLARCCEDDLVALGPAIGLLLAGVGIVAWNLAVLLVLLAA